MITWRGKPLTLFLDKVWNRMYHSQDASNRKIEGEFPRRSSFEHPDNIPKTYDAYYGLIELLNEEDKSQETGSLPEMVQKKELSPDNYSSGTIDDYKWEVWEERPMRGQI